MNIPRTKSIGFTGSSRRITKHQKQWMRRWLEMFYEAGYRWIHLGDCIVADAYAYEVAKEIGFKTCGHPPKELKKRAFLKYDYECDAEDYLARNDMIIEHSHRMLAVPSEKIEKLRSGTWATIRHAKKAGLPVDYIYPQ